MYKQALPHCLLCNLKESNVLYFISHSSIRREVVICITLKVVANSKQ